MGQEKAIMRKDITYISGVQMEEAVEIVRHCFFQDDEMKMTEYIIRNPDEFKEKYMELIRYWNFERCLTEMHAHTGRNTFYYYGHCAGCNSLHPFIVDYQEAEVVEGRKHINWRERMVCPNCRCNSRQRFIIQKIFEAYEIGNKILIYEKNTDFFRAVQREISTVEGFEYAGKDHAGEIEGIYCEDICKLSYPDEEFDIIISNDIFGYTYDYQIAFSEAFRVLKPGGKLIFTVPFNANSLITERRVELCEGTVICVMDKWCHDNPVLGLEPLLINQVFGWDLLEVIKEVGFRDALGKVYYGLKEGYMGYLPIYFEAYK